MEKDTPVLEVRGIVKNYPGVLAVDHADLELAPGEVHALVGENGAGKSTLIKILAGVVQPDEGQILLRGEPVALRSGEDAYRSGLSFIHQELNLIPYLNGAENVFLGHAYPKNIVGTIDWRELRNKAEAVLERLGVSVPLDVPVSQLAPGDQSMIAIARAFAVDASIIVMDEPTASLSDHEINNLFNVINTLKAQGITILYISHRLEEIFAITDRVTVMRDGKVVGTYPTSELSQADIIRLMIGRELKESIPPSQSQAGQVILEARGLNSERVENIHFQLREGEILGIAGLVGSGRTELLNLLYGTDQLSSGTLTLDGAPYEPHSPADAIRRGVVLVPEERHTQGVVVSRSIIENITLPYLSFLTRAGIFLDRKLEAQRTREVGSAVRLKAASLANPVSSLSGGNQQKVVFARWLLKDMRVLLLDEPTRGVDVGARFEIYSIIRELSVKHVGIILVSSDLTELLGLADRLIVLREGCMTVELSTAGLTREKLLHYCYGEE